MTDKSNEKECGVLESNLDNMSVEQESDMLGTGNEGSDNKDTVTSVGDDVNIHGDGPGDETGEVKHSDVRMEEKSLTRAEIDVIAETKNLFPNSKEIDNEAISKLSEGLLGHYLKPLEKTKNSLHELTENQRILIETVMQENAKFAECQTLTDVTETMDKAKLYHDKLIRIKKEMHLLHDKSSKLKRRAIILQQQKQREELLKEQQREAEAAKERQLVAKLAKKTPSNS